MEYCCFDGKAFPWFNFILYGQHALSYVLVTLNVPLVRVKLLRAIKGNLDLYPYSYSCLYERSLTAGSIMAVYGRGLAYCSYEWAVFTAHSWLVAIWADLSTDVGLQIYERVMLMGDFLFVLDIFRNLGTKQLHSDFLVLWYPLIFSGSWWSKKQNL